MGSLFSFDKLITPSIIKFAFYIFVGVIVLIALAITMNGFNTSPDSPIPGFVYIVLAAIVLVVGVIVARIVAEMTLVIFMIRDELAWQRVQQTEKVQTPLS